MRRALAITVLTLGLILSACTSTQDDPDAPDSDLPGRPVTSEEASRLALARYNAWLDSPVNVAIDIPGEMTVQAAVDYKEHLGSGTYVTPDGEHGMIIWTSDDLATAPGADPADVDPDSAVLPGQWTRHPLGDAVLDRAVQLVQGLGDDRPDNAQLIKSGGARHLRSEKCAGVDCEVYAGPRPEGADSSDASPLTYWLSEDGKIRKVTMKRLGGSPAPLVTVELGVGS